MDNNYSFNNLENSRCWTGSNSLNGVEISSEDRIQITPSMLEGLKHEVERIKNRKVYEEFARAVNWAKTGQLYEKKVNTERLNEIGENIDKALREMNEDELRQIRELFESYESNLDKEIESNLDDEMDIK